MGIDFGDAFPQCVTHRDQYLLTHHVRIDQPVCPWLTSLSLMLTDVQKWMPNILLNLLTLVLKCMNLLTTSMTVQVVQIFHPHCQSNQIHVCIHNSTVGLVKLSSLSGFYCFEHAWQVVGQLWHITHHVLCNFFVLPL